MAYTFTLTTTIPALPREIYEAWLDSRGHSEMTGGAARMSAEVGAEVSAWDGYISGRNLELIPGERIVQSWRTSEFGDRHEDSVITIVLQEMGAGTLLTLEHRNVPDEHRSYEEGGWQSHYFEPMMAYFTKREERAAARTLQVRARKRPRQSSTEPPPKRPAKRTRKAARSFARAKAVPKTRKVKGKTPARRTAPAARGAAKRSRPKSGGGKRR
jgi:uncharacterized protein YndB with AHSA1/START domain